MGKYLRTYLLNYLEDWYIHQLDLDTDHDNEIIDEKEYTESCERMDDWKYGIQEAIIGEDD